MNLYVATAFANAQEARNLMANLQRWNYTISYDWTGDALDPEWSATQTQTYLDRCGYNDFTGVRNADALVLINHAACRDSMCEMGIALGLGRPIFVLYPTRQNSVFFRFAQARCHSEYDLYEALSAYTHTSDRLSGTEGLAARQRPLGLFP